MSTPKSTPISLNPVIPLVLEKKNVSMKSEKEKYISFELKIKTNNNRATNNSYTKHVRLFEDGTPYEWIQLVQDVLEIWKQNQILTAANRIALVKTLLRGDSLTTFEAAIQTATAPADDEEEEQPLTDEVVQKALDEVAMTVFPYRALYTQKQWMSKVMRKPEDLPIRATISALRRLNNELPFYPEGSADSKFSAKQLVEIMEWAVPAIYRDEFMKKGFIPTSSDMATFRMEAEIVERTIKSSMPAPKPKTTKRKSTPGTSNADGGNPKKSNKRTKFYCSHHGPNNSHSTAQCKVLLAEKGELPKKGTKKANFSATNVRKELNLLSKKSSKQQVLDKYRRILDREQARLDKKKSVERQQREMSEDEDDTSDEESLHAMEVEVVSVKPSPVDSVVVPRKQAATVARVSTLSVESVTKQSHSAVTKKPPSKPTRASIGKLAAPKPKSKAKLQKEEQEKQQAALKLAAESAISPKTKVGPNKIMPTHLNKKAVDPLDTTPEEKAFLKQVKAAASWRTPVGTSQLKSSKRKSECYFECHVSTADLRRPKKKQKQKHFSPVTIAYIKRATNDRQKRMRVLLDSGCSATLVNKKLLKIWLHQKSRTPNGKPKQAPSRPRRNVKLTLPSLLYIQIGWLKQ